jgi:hypothetical protein
VTQHAKTTTTTTPPHVPAQQWRVAPRKEKYTEYALRKEKRHRIMGYGPCHLCLFYIPYPRSKSTAGKELPSISKDIKLDGISFLG